MSFTPGNIIQYSENYPFHPIAISNLYDLAYRNYDPILGRMNQIDPMATKYASLTPYNFSFNDPVTFTDPSGADPEYGITRYTYDDRVDHYRGQFYSGGSTSALRFHTGGRSGGITNWSYAPSFGQLVQMRNDARSLNSQAYGEKYGEKVSWWLAYSKNNYQDSKEQASMWLYFDKSFHNDFNGVYQWYGVVNGGFARKYAQAYEPWSAKYIDDFEYLANFTQGGGSLWISSGQNALDIFGGLAGAAEGLVVGNDSWLGKNGKYYSNDWQGNQYAGSRSGAYRAAATYRNLGRASIAGTVVLGGVLIYNGYEKDGSKFGYNAQYATASTTGGLVGGWAGASAGATVGAAVGVWFFGVGAVPGAIIGAGFGLAGGIIGGLVGSSVGGSAVDYYHGR